MSSVIDPEFKGSPLVAIVGRPNVGKSTLFNRLVKRRVAITDPTPGVTRDQVTGLWEYEGRTVRLLDTGGIRPGADGIDGIVSKKSIESFAKADCIILLLDVTEITGEDEEVIKSLRSFADKTVVAVNKVDTERREESLGDFWALGFSEIVPVSAAHGRNCDDLAEAVFRLVDFNGTSGEDSESSPSQDITVAILGKPNTGKSTLTNTLLGEERSIVSPVPGTTRDVLEGRFSHKSLTYRILDTAGIRRKAKVTEDVEYYSVNRAIGIIDEADVVYLLIDAVEGLAEQDKKIAAQIVKKGRGVILVLNKWDRMEEGARVFKEAEARLRFLFPVLDFAPVIPVSAKNRWNIEPLLKKTMEINRRLRQRVETGLLNKALGRWIEEYPPPNDGRKRFKLRFMTQVRSHPVRFVLFVNRREGFPAAYFGYIKKRLRNEFDFRDIPLDLEVRDKDRN
jgi:GTP-binding protein